jgi:hypothetical protein
MSMIECDRCGIIIDSDEDPGCFLDNPYDSRDTTVVCLACREREYDEHQEKLMQDGPGPSLLEQQREAMKYK